VEQILAGSTCDSASHAAENAPRRRGKHEAGMITLQVSARGLDTTMSNLLKGL
jgi:hypothetical protein